MGNMSLTDVCSALRLPYGAWKEFVRGYLERHRWVKPLNATQSLEVLAQQLLADVGDYWLGPNSSNRPGEGQILLWPVHRSAIVNLVVAMMRLQETYKRKSHPNSVPPEETLDESNISEPDFPEKSVKRYAETFDPSDSVGKLWSSVGMTDLQGNRLKKAISIHVKLCYTITGEPRTVLDSSKIKSLAVSFLEKENNAEKSLFPQEIAEEEKMKVVLGIIERKEKWPESKNPFAAAEAVDQDGKRAKRRRTGFGRTSNAEHPELRTFRSLSDPTQQALTVRTPFAQAPSTSSIGTPGTHISYPGGENTVEPTPAVRAHAGDPVELILRKRSFEVPVDSMQELCKAFTQVIIDMHYEARRRREKIDPDDQAQITRENVRAEERKEIERRLVDKLAEHGTEVEECD